MSWDRLPREVWDIILQHLDLNTVKTFRLVNRTAARGCLGSRFLAPAAIAETDLTEESLWRLVARALHPTFAYAVRQLTIVATDSIDRGRLVRYSHNGTCLYSNDHLSTASDVALQLPQRLRKANPETEKERSRLKETYQAPSDEFIIAVLVTALDSFLQLDKVKLQSWIVALPQAKYRRASVFWNLKSQPASRACYLTLAAVARSKTPMRAMDIYHNNDRWPFHVQPSNLPTNDFVGHLTKISGDHDGDMRLGLKSLGLNISAVVDIEEHHLRELAIKNSWSFTPSSFNSKNQSSSKPDPSGLIRLLRCVPDLENFNLQFNPIGHGPPNENYHIFTGVADQVHFNHLRSFELADLPVTAHALHKFLQRHHTIRVLQITGAALPGVETWDPIFSFISAEMRLQKLYLGRLYNGGIRMPLYLDEHMARYYPPDHPAHGKISAIEPCNRRGRDIMLSFAIQG
ncbi:uncharacterized protein N7459_006878 [Penicillium hispanicum]|uniref:uncharacterized protein n=1 Tax=Penicillium hispanicum TaxID=1080232 RepID=UPI00253F67A2|nr:uncharacterized protein N7459_006878 [Penicillium hispanicum]KAJ5577914.1 hypothetical protein N7459_006878 [Penicillium hispanicum]